MRVQRGFSMVELVMVMVLVGIIAALASPRLGNLAGYSLHSAAQDLVAAIRYAQQQSMSHSGANPFQIAIGGNGFTVSQNGTAIINPLTGTLGYTEDGSAWSDVSVSAGTGTIAFDSRGQPTCSSGLAACSLPGDSNAILTLAKGGESLTVTVERYTGYARAN
jgi:MSHA pilin protein MshC